MNNTNVIKILESIDIKLHENDFNLNEAAVDKDMQEIYKQLSAKPSDAFSNFLSSKAAKKIGIGAFGFRSRILYNNLRKLARNAFDTILTKLVQPILSASLKTNEIIYKELITKINSNPDSDVNQVMSTYLDRIKKSTENTIEKVKQAVANIVGIYSSKMTAKINDANIKDKNKTALLAYWTLLTTYIELMINQYINLKNVESIKKIMADQKVDPKKQEEVIKALDKETNEMLAKLNELVNKKEKESSEKGNEVDNTDNQQPSKQQAPTNSQQNTQPTQA